MSFIINYFVIEPLIFQTTQRPATPTVVYQMFGLGQARKNDPVIFPSFA